MGPPITRSLPKRRRWCHKVRLGPQLCPLLAIASSRSQRRWHASAITSASMVAGSRGGDVHPLGALRLVWHAGHKRLLGERRAAAGGRSQMPFASFRASRCRRVRRSVSLLFARRHRQLSRRSLPRGGQDSGGDSGGLRRGEAVYALQAALLVDGPAPPLRRRHRISHHARPAGGFRTHPTARRHHGRHLVPATFAGDPHARCSLPPLALPLCDLL